MSFKSANGFGRFMNLVTSGKLAPARSNLFSVEIAIPPVLLSQDPEIRSKWRHHYDAINYLADEVTLPGRRITTGQLRTVGAMRRFATDSTFGEVQISFILPQDLYHRTYFERWMNYTASDAENRVTLYDEYTTQIVLNKWELGSGIVFKGPDKNGRKMEQRLNRVTGTWQLYGAFPFDMSAITLSNAQADLIRLDVSFYYERYRFDTVAESTLPFTLGSKDKVIDNFDNVATVLGYGFDQIDVADFGI